MNGRMFVTFALIVLLGYSLLASSALAYSVSNASTSSFPTVTGMILAGPSWSTIVRWVSPHFPSPGPEVFGFRDIDNNAYPRHSSNGTCWN